MSQHNFSASDLQVLVEDLRSKELLLAMAKNKQYNLLDEQSTLHHRYNANTLKLQLHGHLALAHIKVTFD